MATGLTDGLTLGFSKVAQAVLALVAQKALLRGQSETDYGCWIAFMLTANVALALLTWPMVSVLRLGAEEWQSRRALGRTLVLHVLLLVGSLLLIAAPAYEARLSIDRYVKLDGATFFVLAYAFVAALGNVVGAHLKPAGRTAQFAILPLVTRLFWAGALVGAVFVLGKTDLNVRGTVLICITTAVPQLLIAIGLVARKAFPPAKPHARDAERAIRFGIPVVARQLGMQAFAYVNFMVLYPVLGVIEAGRFQIAATLSEQAAVLAGGVDDLMGPILARAASRGETKPLEVYYRALAPQVVLGWSALAGAAIVLARPILHALSAKAIDATAPALEVLLVATAVRVIVALETPVLDAHLISGPVLLFYGLGFATNLGLSLYFVPKGYGVEAAAWATLAGWSVNSIARSVYVRACFRVGSLRLYAWLWPAVAALLWATLVGPRGPLIDVAVAVGVIVAALALGKVTGTFAPETLAALEGVRMPPRVRRALAAFYGVKLA